MSILSRIYGETKEQVSVNIFTLKNINGVEVTITNFGGIVVSIKVPDRKGIFKDVVLGYDKLEDYLSNDCYFGAIIGRYANRIEDARFLLNEIEYKVGKNSGKHQLHGGFVGFDKVVWQWKVIEVDRGEALQLTYTSKDWEEGFPGELKVQVTYMLTEDNALEIEYLAVSDKDTVVSLTNHSYFNLLGEDTGDILSHELMIDADSFTLINEDCIPTGQISAVAGTPFDFTRLKAIGKDIEVEDEQLKNGFGYDHNFVLKVSGKIPEKFAELYEERNGRLMEAYTTMPGVQLYSGNYLESSRAYTNRSGVCLETQYFPSSMNHINFPSPILKAKEQYKHRTIYKFSVK
ncbi:galactose mutarotase [Clostridium sp. CS001]|uniref:aldose epimerase family protein n=1 Tax=Clostridium sp. CS001 TaxID=2880648 RepID=UPI001CF2DE85|nr:aldose epimerase family protein [Clostridium sp. CS001]MCB2290559.1 galactose mutarotase [Clostridium sp. CS001]